MALWFAMLWAIAVLRDWRPQRRSRGSTRRCGCSRTFSNPPSNWPRRSATERACASAIIVQQPPVNGCLQIQDLATGSRPSDRVVRRPRSGSLAERHEDGAAAARRHSRSLLRVDLSIDRRASDRRVLGGPSHCMERRRGAADCAAQTETKAGRRRPDPLAKVTEQLHTWFTARTGRELLARLQVE